MGHSEYISIRVFSASARMKVSDAKYIYIFLLPEAWTKSSLLIYTLSYTKISNSPLNYIIYCMAS